jgi:hypothetical protein
LGAHAAGQAGGVPALDYEHSPHSTYSPYGDETAEARPAIRRAVQSPAGPGYTTRAVRRARRKTHRRRYLLKPWLTLAQVVAAGLSMNLIPPARPLWWIALLAGAAYGAFVQYPRRRQGPRSHLYFALACVTAASAWIAAVTADGMFAGAGRLAILAIAVPGLWPLSWKWWEYHRIRPRDEERVVAERAARPAPDPIPLAWDQYVGSSKGLFPGARLIPLRSTEGVREYLIEGVPGRHTTRALTTEDALHKIAGALGADPDLLVLERPAKGARNGANARLMVLTERNDQLQESLSWAGPTLNPETGLFRPAVYADGPATAPLFQVADGRPHRGLNAAVCGLMGKGKSRFTELRVAELLWSQIAVVWYGDGQEGASGPVFRDHVDWYATRRDEIKRMLIAAYRILRTRQRHDEEVQWTDALGHHRTGRGFWPGSAEEPFLEIVLDECQELLKDPHVAKLVRELQRKGPKLGIQVNLITQEFLVYETGGSSGDPGAQSIRTFAQTGLVVLFKSGSGINADALGGTLVGINPRTLPDEPGWCYMLGPGTDDRHPKARMLHIGKDEIYDWLARASSVKAHLDDLSVRAAGDDYRTRWQRLNEIPAADSDDTLADIEAEIDSMLGLMPGAGKPMVGASLKEAVLLVVREKGPIKRADIDTELAAAGRTASTSTIAQALKSWSNTGYLVSKGNGVWDVTDREDRAAIDAEQRAGQLETAAQD